MSISGGDALLGRASVLLGPQVDPNFARDAEKGILGPLQGIAGKVTGILVGAFAARELFSFFKESAKAASENEKSIRLLQFSFDAFNVSLADQAGAEKWIASMSKARGVLEDQLRPAVSQALRFTGDLTQAENLVSLAQDIAIARGRDLGSVVTALGRASTGNVAILQRLGLAIKDAGGHTLSAQEAFAKLHQQFGGAGLAAMNTADGRARALGVSMHELKVQVGDLLLPVLQQIGGILINDVIPPIRAVIGWIGDLNGMTGGWAGKVLLAAVSLTTLAFAVQKIIAIGAALSLFLQTTISQLGTGAAVAASYAGGLLGTAEANVVATSAAGSAATAFQAEQLSLFGTVPAVEATQLSLFALVPAEEAAAAGAVGLGAAAAGARVGVAGMLGPLALLVTGAVLLGRTLDHAFPDGGDNPLSKAVKEITKDMTTFTTADFRAELQKAADRLHELGFDPFKEFHKDFDELLKKTPQLAQQFLNFAASLKGGAEGTKGWQAELDQLVAKIKQNNATNADWQKTIDGTAGSILDENAALADLVNQTGDEAIAMARAGLAGDAFRASQDAGKKANEEHAKAFNDLVIAIGPYEAALAAAGGLTTQQMSDMAKSAEQFSTDFATALLSVSDPLSFFGGLTDVTAGQLQAFFDQTLAATQAWAQNLQFAVAIGINEGFVQELAKAGPKSAPILRGILDLAAQSSVDVTNQLITGTQNVATISHNIWSGMSLDAILAARSMIHSVQDVFGWLNALGSATAAVLKGPAAVVGLPTQQSVGVPKLPTGGGGSTAITKATDAVAESLKQLQDQFKVGEITEQQLADQAGAMWSDTEKFSQNWMAIWDILHANAEHLATAASSAAKIAQDAADKAAQAAQAAADKAAAAAQAAADKIAAAAQKAADEYQVAFDDIASILGQFGATALKTRGLSTEQLKAMTADLRSFQSSVASSFNSAASAVAAFGNQTEVTGQQLIDFQRQSLQDAINWSHNITLLMQMGLDQSLLRPLAEAGPKAASLVRAYLDEIGLIGVGAVNQNARSQASILANTSGTLLAGMAGTTVSPFGWQGSSTATPPQINSTFTVQGSVYGVADLNAYMDQRDAALAAAIAAGTR